MWVTRLLLWRQYQAAKEQHRHKRDIYIRLHREIKAHEASVGALLVRPLLDLVSSGLCVPYCRRAGLLPCSVPIFTSGVVY